ncbi:MAG: hypothetical protein AAB393_16725 [Bacteroidota bacterium]
MKQILVLLTCASLLACSVDTPGTMPSDGGDPSLVSLQKPVPFRATLSGGGLPPVPSASCNGLLLTELAGEGIATHLGRFTAVQHHCLNPATFTFGNGVLEYTAANGHKVFGTYSGFLSPTPNPVIAEITGAWEFAGGTGRFASATGSGAASGQLDVTTGNFSLTLDGSISY